MSEEEIPDPWAQDDQDERSRRIAAYRAQQRAKRQAFLDKLLGSSDRHERQAPPPVEDFEETLGEHAAQLRNATRMMMGNVLWDDASVEQAAMAAGALTRLIQTNIAIAKTLNGREPRAKSKTVRGGRSQKAPQD